MVSGNWQIKGKDQGFVLCVLYLGVIKQLTRKSFCIIEAFLLIKLMKSEGIFACSNDIMNLDKNS